MFTALGKFMIGLVCGVYQGLSNFTHKVPRNAIVTLKVLPHELFDFPSTNKPRSKIDLKLDKVMSKSSQNQKNTSGNKLKKIIHCEKRCVDTCLEGKTVLTGAL